MSKSVYSLVLTDEVVEAVDSLAYTMGISRSGLIDRILAERVSFTTPEMRINDIFDSLNRYFSAAKENFIVEPGDQSMLIRSSLKYKYNPTIRYGLRIFRGSEKTMGEIRVNFRTQSAELRGKMEEFLHFWAMLENEYTAKYIKGKIRYIISEGKLTREFTLPEEYNDKTTEETGEAIAEYIRMFDAVLKCYFACGSEREARTKAAEKFVGYLESGIAII